MALFQFDVFVSYSDSESKWVREWLLPQLDEAGLDAAIDVRDFEVGLSTAENLTKCIEKSQWIALIVSPRWLAQEWSTLASLLERAPDSAAILRRVILIVLEKCELPAPINTLTYADFTQADQRVAKTRDLIELIRKTIQSRPRSAGRLRARQLGLPFTPLSPPPDGLDLVWELPVSRTVTQVSWSPDGQILATTDSTGEIGIYDTRGRPKDLFSLERGAPHLTWAATGTTVAFAEKKYVKILDINDRTTRTLYETGGVHHVLAWSPNGNLIAIGTRDRLSIVDATTGGLIASHSLQLFVHEGHVSWSPDGKRLSVTTPDGFVVVSSSGVPLARFDAPRTYRILWTPDGKFIVASSSNGTIRVLDSNTTRQVQVLEAHSDQVGPMAISGDGRLLASGSKDSTVRIWRCDRWEQLAQLPVHATSLDTLSFHPREPLLAILEPSNDARLLRIWRLDYGRLTARPSSTQAVYYRNAKVVLVGDSSVGKSGLGLVLSGKPFTPTESTHARRVWTFETFEADLGEARHETRETYLWDMAGQPGYRLIHQLHLDEVAVALVVLDAKSETDPFAGVGHWDRALRTAVRIQGTGAPPLRKFLVAARTDRGGVAASAERIRAKVDDLGFDGYFETSAKEGWGIAELKEAVRGAIAWNQLPQVSSTALFQRIRDFLIHEKKSGRLLTTADDLYFTFIRQAGEAGTSREQFHICLGRLESRDLVRRLSFGSLILLQPEYLDAYASAIVNEAKAEPDGLGAIAEEKVLSVAFRMSKDERINDANKERLLLVATVEDMLRREIALREHEQDGPHLVFPSQLTRENPDLPDPEGKALVLSFEGPTQNIYATLAVRMSHSRLFTKKEMWRNAVVFSAIAGGTCGIALREYGEGRGDLILFYGATTGSETRLLFNDYVESHVQARAIPQSVTSRPVVFCRKCNTEVSDTMVQRRLQRGHDYLNCPVCDVRVRLHPDTPPVATQHTAADMEAMDRAADKARDREAGLLSALAAMSTADFAQWAGTAPLTFAFTSAISTSPHLFSDPSSEEDLAVQNSFVERARRALRENGGYEIKSLGDTLMVAFRAPNQAVSFALDLLSTATVSSNKVRVAIDGNVSASERERVSSTIARTAKIEDQISEHAVWVADDVRLAMAAHAGHERNLIWTPCTSRAVDDARVFWSVHRNPSVSMGETTHLQPPTPSEASVVFAVDRSDDDFTALHELLTEHFGGSIARQVTGAGTVAFDCVGINTPELLRLAENGLLFGLANKAGAKAVREIRSGGEVVFDDIPAVQFNSPSIKDVSPAKVKTLVSELDLLLVTTTPVERDAVLSAMLPLPKQKSLLEAPLEHATYRVGRFGRYYAAHVESTMGTSGRDGATLTVNDAIRELQPKAVLVLGIAFGVNRKKQRLGDVIVAESVFPYELQRVGETVSVRRGREIPCGSVLSERFRVGSAHWVLERPTGQVKVHQGLLLSGEKLIDNSLFRDRLVEEFRDALGGEMEGAGAYASGSRTKTEVILLKAICDWADGHKNDRAQPFAAKAAVSLAQHVLSKRDVLAALGARDRGLPRKKRGKR
ncbi:TIR domain-containing protein [Polyangium sp. y55x31]|uniref:WD40 domain-containing protein n=1 Tax=Polyangium sp. y55x31 TaxID=3042688 RepID=UPI0024832522|nr:TIR domain-containing protein [Polyangium sp. y55x31]MDI1476441.1 TIR domain-containing protein [Polyangium sp. y55x31]